jgi:hydrogenase-4 component B
VVIGLGPRLVAPVLDAAVGTWEPAATHLKLSTLAPLIPLSIVGGALAFVTVAVTARAMRAGGASASASTWDCGYAAPSPTMQYTSSSFAAMLVEPLSGLLGLERHVPQISSPFPAKATFDSHVPDLVLDRAVLPAVRFGARGLSWFRWVQRGAVQLYLLYVLATLVVLLLFWR